MAKISHHTPTWPTLLVELMILETKSVGKRSDLPQVYSIYHYVSVLSTPQHHGGPRTVEFLGLSIGSVIEPRARHRVYSQPQTKPNKTKHKENSTQKVEEGGLKL